MSDQFGTADRSARFERRFVADRKTASRRAWLTVVLSLRSPVQLVVAGAIWFFLSWEAAAKFPAADLPFALAFGSIATLLSVGAGKALEYWLERGKANRVLYAGAEYEATFDADGLSVSGPSISYRWPYASIRAIAFHGQFAVLRIHGVPRAQVLPRQLFPDSGMPSSAAWTHADRVGDSDRRDPDAGSTPIAPYFVRGVTVSCADVGWHTSLPGRAARVYTRVYVFRDRMLLVPPRPWITGSLSRELDRAARAGDLRPSQITSAVPSAFTLHAGDVVRVVVIKNMVYGRAQRWHQVHFERTTPDPPVVECQVPGRRLHDLLGAVQRVFGNCIVDGRFEPIRAGDGN